MKSNVSFKKRLNTLLARKLKRKDGAVDFDAMLGKSATYLDLVLFAQIKKACAGDTSCASFLRDTSGNKLKERAQEEKRKGVSPFDLV